MVELPVYYSWSFTTGEDGNFESLARKLKPAVAPPGVGRRRVDATQPWLPAALTADDPGAEIVVEGPVVSPQKPEDVPPAEQVAERGGPASGTQAVTDELIAASSDQRPTAAGDTRRPILGRPWSARRCTARTTRGSRGSRPRSRPRSRQPQWFRELNLDPRNRIVGGLGTRVVQAEQEDLMAAAWNQVIGVEAANRALRLAQLAKQVAPRCTSGTSAALSEAGAARGHRAGARKSPGRTGAGASGPRSSEQPAARRHHRRVPPADPRARPGRASRPPSSPHSRWRSRR